MSTPHRATEEQWEMQGEWARISTERLASGTARCLLELRSRVELLEATQHAHLDGSQLSEAEREAMTEPGRVVAGQPEPPTLVTDDDLRDVFDEGPGTVVDGFRALYDLGRQHGAAQVAPVQSLMERVEALASGDAPVFDPRANVTGKGVTVEGSFDQDGTTYVFKTAAQPAPSAQPEPPTLQESQASKAHYEAELARLKCEAMQQPATDAPPPLRCPGAHTIAECGGPCEDDFRLCDCGLLQQLNPAPAVKDSLTDAPAGSLVELLQREIGCAFPEDAQRGICAIAKWLDKNGFPVSAARLRRKAACPAPAAKESSAAASAKSLVQRMLNAMDEHFEAQRGPAPAGSLMERVGKARANARVLGYDEDRAAFCVVAAWLREKDSEREMGGDAAATADLIEQEASG